MHTGARHVSIKPRLFDSEPQSAYNLAVSRSLQPKFGSLSKLSIWFYTKFIAKSNMALPILPSVVQTDPARDYEVNYILHWNSIALDLVRITHTISGFQNGPPLTARFLGIFHLAMHDAYFSVFPYNDPTTRPDRNKQFDNDFVPYLSNLTAPANVPKNATNAEDAVSGAAITVLNKLFKTPDKRDAGVSSQSALALGNFVDSSFDAYMQAHKPNVSSPAFFHGVAVARRILDQLETKVSEPGTDAKYYKPMSNKTYWFDNEPLHPVRLRPVDPNDPTKGDKATRPYHGPFYGTTAALFATTEDILIADPPVNPDTPPSHGDAAHIKYLESLEDVHRMGGAEGLSSTKRRPTQTAGGLFWAYDGANLIGTPPRLYNQIVRQIAYDERQDEMNVTSDQNNAEFVRLLALVNVAMADAGIFSWRDKYKYQLWRPLSGVRADPSGPVPDGFSRPFWKTFGAPATNSNDTGFKPPFPAYPSGHATFGAAAFHITRLFYNQRGDKRLGPPADTDNERTKAAPDAGQAPTPPPSDPLLSAMDPIKFTFISDELNGVSRTLDHDYIPSRPIEDQPGDVRTLLPITYCSLKEAIFANAMSRIWLGVHWHFDGFAGETVLEPFNDTVSKNDITRDRSLPRPKAYQQKFNVEEDGSSKYLPVAKMDWFAKESKGPRCGSGAYPVGGVPLGMMIAANIFDNKMRSKDSMIDLGASKGMRRL